MERAELLLSKEYWLAKIQTQLFSEVQEYIDLKQINRTIFSQELGVSKGYVTQVLNGDYDNRISKLVELSLAIGKAPLIEFRNLQSVIDQDRFHDKGAVFYQSSITLVEFTPYELVEDKQEVNYADYSSQQLPETSISLKLENKP